MVRDCENPRVSRAERLLGAPPEVYFPEKRYEIIRNVILPQVFKGARPLTLSDLLDKVFLHRYLGIPIFIALFWALFRFAFDVSAPLSELIELGFAALAEWARHSIADPELASLVADGVCAGLGSVLVFVPPIFFAFLGIAILEDSGYLARAAFVTDRPLSKCGLQGRSCIPLLLGFGCNVPAVMATRTIPEERDRFLTILTVPYVACSARLPVFIMLGMAIFGRYALAAVFAMYLLSVGLVFLVPLILSKVVPRFRKERSYFIMELPMYARPAKRGLVIHMWERGVEFLKKAGLVIFTVAVVVWYLTTHPWGVPMEETYIARLGRFLAPLFAPLGWDWRAAVALLFGLLAKEVIVGTWGVLLGVEEEEAGAVAEALASAGVFDTVSGFAYMVFCLAYMPCLATLAVIYKETRSVKWTVFALLFSVFLAYVLALAVTFVGRLVSSVMWGA